ncbi:MAG: T9SS type A sorting domain-containing protein [Candidatus Cloacimonetes bacterium]|nr:T9SS type A sorting domain-containing protein [Candidatus Cloacimonadota bacterium]
MLKINISTIIILTVLFSLISANELDLNFKEVYFRFEISERSELETLTRIISIDNVKEHTVFAYANPKEFKEFLNLEYNYEILPHPGTLIDPVMATSKDQMRDWDTYPTYETYVSMMNDFETNYPALCEIVDVGNTNDGRDLLFAKISDNVATAEDEPEFMYTATIHGDETAGYVLMLRLIDYLLTNYGTDPRITNLVDNVEIWINPLSNPDGTYAGGNSSVSGATRGNANGIDMNRNYRDPEDGDHPDGNAWQMETIAMMDLAEAQNFVLSVNFHGGEEVVNYPWDTWATLHADDDWYQEISRTYADTVHVHSPTGYMDGYDNGITNGYEWYSISGGRQDYMNYFQGCREVTIELSSTKLLPESELENHWNYNRQSFLLYMEECLYGVRGIVTDENDAPLEATISIVGYDNNNSEVVNDPTIGNYHRMLYTGTYDFTFTASGYDPIMVEDVVVTDNDITYLNVQFGVADVTQSIDLDTGWSLSSLNVHPADMTPESIFSPVLSNLMQIKDLTETYSPSNPPYLNTLDELTDGFGYWINVDADVTLDVTAPAIDVAATTIQLDTGWNLAGYVCQSAQDVAVALAGITTELEQVKSLTETYDPNLPPYMNTLDQMEPDFGYWINVNAPCDLIYPVPTRDDEPKISNLREYPNWEPVIYPNNSAVVYGTIEIDGIPVDENDLIGVFINDECRGAGSVNFFENTAYLTLVINIAENLEIASFKLYDSSEDIVYDLENTLELNSGDTVGSYPDELVLFEVFTTGIEEGEVTDSEIIGFGNYPNPFQSATTISFQLNTENNENTEVEIYNLKGQKIRQYSIFNNRFSISWDGKDAAGNDVKSGIYFSKLKTGDKIKYNRMVLIR